MFVGVDVPFVATGVGIGPNDDRVVTRKTTTYDGGGGSTTTTTESTVLAPGFTLGKRRMEKVRLDKLSMASAAGAPIEKVRLDNKPLVASAAGAAIEKVNNATAPPVLAAKTQVVPSLPSTKGRVVLNPYGVDMQNINKTVTQTEAFQWTIGRVLAPFVPVDDRRLMLPHELWHALRPLIAQAAFRDKLVEAVEYDRGASSYLLNQLTLDVPHAVRSREFFYRDPKGSVNEALDNWINLMLKRPKTKNTLHRKVFDDGEGGVTDMIEIRFQFQNHGSPLHDDPNKFRMIEAVPNSAPPNYDPHNTKAHEVALLAGQYTLAYHPHPQIVVDTNWAGTRPKSLFHLLYIAVAKERDFISISMPYQSLASLWGFDPRSKEQWNRKAHVDLAAVLIEKYDSSFPFALTGGFEVSLATADHTGVVREHVREPFEDEVTLPGRVVTDGTTVAEIKPRCLRAFVPDSESGHPAYDTTMDGGVRFGTSRLIFDRHVRPQDWVLMENLGFDFSEEVAKCFVVDPNDTSIAHVPLPTKRTKSERIHRATSLGAYIMASMLPHILLCAAPKDVVEKAKKKFPHSFKRYMRMYLSASGEEMRTLHCQRAKVLAEYKASRNKLRESHRAEVDKFRARLHEEKKEEKEIKKMIRTEIKRLRALRKQQHEVMIKKLADEDELFQKRLDAQKSGAESEEDEAEAVEPEDATTESKGDATTQPAKSESDDDDDGEEDVLDEKVAEELKKDVDEAGLSSDSDQEENAEKTKTPTEDEDENEEGDEEGDEEGELVSTALKGSKIPREKKSDTSGTDTETETETEVKAEIAAEVAEAEEEDEEAEASVIENSGTDTDTGTDNEDEVAPLLDTLKLYEDGDSDGDEPEDENDDDDEDDLRQAENNIPLWSQIPEEHRPMFRFLVKKCVRNPNGRKVVKNTNHKTIKDPVTGHPMYLSIRADAVKLYEFMQLLQFISYPHMAQRLHGVSLLFRPLIAGGVTGLYEMLSAIPKGKRTQPEYIRLFHGAFDLSIQLRIMSRVFAPLADCK